MVDLDAIRQLAAIYPILVDSHDLEHLVALFTEDATFHRAGHVHAGREELRRFFAQIMDTYSMMAHTGHQHVVDLAPGATVAFGVQMGHGELELAGQRVVAAYRYDDQYRCVEGRWLFARREMRYQYFSTHDELGTEPVRSAACSRAWCRTPGRGDSGGAAELSGRAGGPRGEGLVVGETEVRVPVPLDRAVRCFAMWCPPGVGDSAGDP